MNNLRFVFFSRFKEMIFALCKTNKFYILQLLLFISCLGLPKQIFSQSITYSQYELTEKGYNYSKVLGQTDEGVYVLQSNLSLDFTGDRVGFKARKYRLMFFDYDLKPIWKQEIIPNQKEQSIEEITFAQSKVLILLTKDAGNNKIEYYPLWVSQKGSLNGGNVKAFEIQYEKGSDINKLNSTASNNSNRLLLLGSEKTSTNKQIFHFISIDTTSAVLLNSKLQLDYNEDQFKANEFDISNEGDAVLKGVYYEEGKAKKNKMYTGITKLFVYGAGKENAVEYEFNLPDKNITGVSISFDNLNRQLLVAGFYLDKESTAGSGVAFARYDMINLGTANIYFNPIRNDNSALKGERNAEYGATLFNYRINKIVPRNDGGIALSAEAVFVTENSYYDYFTQSFTRRIQYNYGNVLVLSINADGSIDWSKLIRKEQESTDDGGVYSSYIHLVLNEKVYFFFNRNVYQNNEVIKVSITNNGVQDEKDFIRNADHITIIPRYGKQVAAEDVILPVIQKKRMLLARISFL